MGLLRFFDWLLELPPRLELEFDRKLETIAKEKVMPYVTSWERRGVARGRREGRKEGLRTGARKGLREGLLEALELGLKLRFGEKALRAMPRLRRVADVTRLRGLKAALCEAESLSGFLSKVATSGR